MRRHIRTATLVAATFGAAMASLPVQAQEAAAQSGFTAAAIWSAGDLSQCTRRPWDDAFADCLASLGAGEDVVAFAQAVLDAPEIGMAAVMTGFDERGAVDLARVEFPGAANANAQVLFINGSDPLVSPMTMDFAAPEDRISQSILTAYPDAGLAGPPWAAGYRDLPGGSQRYVLADRVTEGCRACAILGTSVSFVDFQDGALIGVSPGLWAPPEVALDGTEAAAAMEAGNVAVLQFRLNLAGYEAGGADGRTGPRTRAALEAFLADNCLPSLTQEPEFRPASIAVLAGLSPSACAADAVSDPVE